MNQVINIGFVGKIFMDEGRHFSNVAIDLNLGITPVKTSDKT